MRAVSKATMRNHATRVAGLMLTLGSNSTAMAANAHLEYGQYLCKSDRTAMIQLSPKQKDKGFAGNIHIPPDFQTIYLTIGKVQNSDHDGPDVITHRTDTCFSSQQMNALKGDIDLDAPSASTMPEGDKQVFITQCLASSRLDIKTGSSSLPYYSLGRNTYEGLIGGRFFIANNLDFVWYFYSLENDLYVSQGHCGFLGQK